MRIGDDVPVGGDDEARACALRLELALRAAARRRSEAAEELVERVVLGKLRHARSAPHALRDIDRHDGRASFSRLREIGSPCDCRAAAGGRVGVGAKRKYEEAIQATASGTVVQVYLWLFRGAL